MSPIQNLINLIDLDLHYTIGELSDKCQIYGLNISVERLKKACVNREIPYLQPGGRFHQREIIGVDFVDYLKKTN